TTMIYTLSLHDALPISEIIKQKVIDEYKKVAKVVEYTPEQADAATEEYHATMDRKDERDKKIADLKERWRELGLMKSQVVKILRSEEHTSELQSRFDLV